MEHDVTCVRQYIGGGIGAHIVWNWQSLYDYSHSISS